MIYMYFNRYRAYVPCYFCAHTIIDKITVANELIKVWAMPLTGKCIVGHMPVLNHSLYILCQG